MDELFRQYLADGERAGRRFTIGVPRSIQRGLYGGHMGNRSGSSLEYMDHREYIPGDDLRRIDWNVFARSDKLAIKLFRDEVNPHVDIVIDCSRSMSLPQSQKACATLGLAGIFAQASINTDYSYTAWHVKQTCEKILNGADRPMLWEGIDFESSSDCMECFSRYVPPWRPRGIRVLISDLFWPGEPMATLSVLAERASAVFVVQVLAQSDVEPPQRGHIRLRDCETFELKDIYIDASLQKKYRQNLAIHQHNWNRGCRQIQAVMTTIVAESIVGEWKLDELVSAEILKVQ